MRSLLASGLQLGCNILYQPKVICGRNQDSFVRPESDQGASEGFQTPGKKHIGFFLGLGRKIPDDLDQEKAILLFICTILQYD